MIHLYILGNSIFLSLSRLMITPHPRMEGGTEGQTEGRTDCIFDCVLSESHIDVRTFLTESQCYRMDFNGSAQPCVCFAPKTCSLVRLGQNTIHLHLMAGAFKCGEL